NGSFTGQVTTADTLTITGKDLFATSSTSTDAIRLEGPLNSGNALTLSTAGGAPAGAGTYLNTTITISGGSSQVQNPVTLTGSSTVTGVGLRDIAFTSTIDGG